MALDNEQIQVLSEIGSQLLTALDKVAGLARAEINRSASSAYSSPLAPGYNPIVGGIDPKHNLGANLYQNQQHLKRLEREPFVARIVFRWEDESPPREEMFYITRASAVGTVDKLPGIKLATYVTPVGRLAEFDAGENTTIKVGGRTRKATILERVRLSPKLLDGEWDALEDFFEFVLWDGRIDSIRQFLEQLTRSAETLEEAVPDMLGDWFDRVEEAREVVRRKVIERITLRDQPILDRYQGEIFRMPLDERLVLLGPPGTGKTTTLIRRLAKIRTPDDDARTTEENEALSAAGLQEAFLYSHSWAMFSPTELLKLYLRDAFNREGVPASDKNLKTWNKERLHLGKNVLAVLRSAESGRFQLDESANILSNTSSPGVRQLYEEFAPYLEKEVLARVTEAFNQLQLSDNEELRRLIRVVIGQRRGEVRFSIREISSLLEEATQLQPVMKRLEEQIKQDLRRLANRLVYTHQNLLEELVEALPSIIREDVDDEEEEEEEIEETSLSQPREPRSQEERQWLAAKILETTLRNLARAFALGRSTIGGQSGRVMKFLGDRLPPRESLSQVGASIVTRSHLRSLMQAPRLFVMGAPQIYNRFRRQALKDGSLFKPDLSDAIKQMRLSPDEVDVLILTMLRNARRLFKEKSSQLIRPSPHDWLENIKSQYLMQIFVDEATDFSAVQLACTMELSQPRLRSWFACGDLNQRITSYGIQDVAEIE